MIQHNWCCHLLQPPQIADCILRIQNQNGSFGYGRLPRFSRNDIQILGTRWRQCLRALQSWVGGRWTQVGHRNWCRNQQGMNTYYGHLLAAPLRAENVDPKDYLPLAQYRKSKFRSNLRFSLTNLQKANITCCLTKRVGDLPTKLQVTKSSISTSPNKKSAADLYYSGMLVPG